MMHTVNLCWAHRCRAGCRVTPNVPGTLKSRKQGKIYQRQNGRWLAISALPRVTVNCNQPSWLIRRDELSTLKKGCKGCAEKAGVAAWKAGKVQSPGGKGARRLNLIETYKQAAPRITRFREPLCSGKYRRV
ncbi:hypothetical protein F5144DRAFT_594391 [Chaetomium tenue]|uniref:Uncharacterized protein n=1 Tax=Chaetomium tenue TaxID=1854479 RepID=A0ACB7P2S5_9PEZI|nr:hypothetical protein F5144DRAFT_594391 [Chaetomium globosum]